MFGVQRCLNAGYGEQGRERFCNPVARLKSHVLGLGEGWTWVEGEAGRIKACYRSALCTAVSLWEGLDGCRRGGACKRDIPTHCSSRDDRVASLVGQTVTLVEAEIG